MTVNPDAERECKSPGGLLNGLLNGLLKGLVLVYKCIHNQAPSYIQNLFKIKSCSYNLRGSGTILEMPRCNLEWRHKSFSFIAARTWNSLPPFIREAEDLSTFKRLLNDYYK